LLILHPANVATPEEAVSGLVVQASVAPVVPVPLVIAMVIGAELPVTVLPLVS
jgi:hypothetical protein